MNASPLTAADAGPRTVVKSKVPVISTDENGMRFSFRLMLSTAVRTALAGLRRHFHTRGMSPSLIIIHMHAAYIYIHHVYILYICFLIIRPIA